MAELQEVRLETSTHRIGSVSNPNTVGEGALLAIKGSPIGWGTEFAGSTRIPATFNNLYSLKASCGRLPMHGVATGETSLPSHCSTIAIISWDFPLLKHMAMLSLGISAFGEDPLALDMPWRPSKIRELTLRRPVFAVLECDGNVQPQPPIRRALRSTIHSLRSAGYQVLQWDPPPHAAAVQSYFKIIGADGALATREQIKVSGEPPVPMLKDWYFNDPTPPLPLPDYLGLLRSQELYQADYQRYWKSTSTSISSRIPVDGVILPVCAHAACAENTLTYFGW